MFNNGLPLNIDVQQIALHMLNFVILVGGLYILLYKPIKDFIDKRIEFYRVKDESANQVLEGVKEKEAQYNDKLAKASQEIDDMKNNALKEAKDAADKKIEEAENKASKIIAEAKETAKREHDKIVSEANTEVAKLAAKAAAKILDESDAYESFAKAVKEN